MHRDARDKWITGFEALSHAQDQIALKSAVSPLVRALGAERFVFLTVSVDRLDDSLTERQVLVDCDEYWLKSYLERKWFVTDPGLSYARRASSPVGATTIPYETDGQRILRQHDIAYGFRSKLIVPAHLPVAGRVGVLYLGRDDDTWEGEPALVANKLFFRMLAIELLDWFHAQMRRDMTVAIGLTERDTSILNLLRRGFSASHIASELNLSKPTIYSYFRQLNQKFCVNHITRVVEQATHLGLLEH
ncbi:autoinducer binding domain-containing protein (plasmid) [Burkholderia aenigmatica]|uniref:autoinducer binding domain-containing protein n=1 Tax=Burkholderia aenigmatica TaxID=2015348 RepID=UPI003B432900